MGKFSEAGDPQFNQLLPRATFVKWKPPRSKAGQQKSSRKARSTFFLKKKILGIAFRCLLGEKNFQEGFFQGGIVRRRERVSRPSGYLLDKRKEALEEGVRSKSGARRKDDQEPAAKEP